MRVQRVSSAKSNEVKYGNIYLPPGDYLLSNRYLLGVRSKRFDLSSHFAAKDRYSQNKHDAYRLASATMTDFLGIPIQITEWSGRASRALSQWGGARFPWEEILRTHRDPDRLDMAIWTGTDRLGGLVLGLTTGQSLVLRFVEGDPRADCPIRGQRILIALEAAANYAQARGKKELRVQPKNEKLVALYEKIYGFVRESPRNEAAYYKKGV